MNSLFRRPLYALVIGILLIFPLPALAQANLTAADAQAYRKAFYALDKNKLGDALVWSKKAQDKTLAKVIRGYVMGEPGNDFTFAEIAAFIESNPDWPGMNDLRRMAEQKIPQTMAQQQVVNWFTAHPPLSLAGFYRHMDALLATAPDETAIAAVRQKWMDGDFTRDELMAFYNRFSAWLRPQDHAARLDNLLWDNNRDAVRAMGSHISKAQHALAEARLQLGSENCVPGNVLAQVPASLQNDPGILLGRLHWARVNDRDSEALSLLQHEPRELKRPELWWNERHILIRRLMEKRDYAGAFELARRHEAMEGQKQLQADFMAGWLALRFLNRPEEARVWFEKLYDDAATPMSQSRGAYWIARSSEAMGDTVQARQWYDIAASIKTSFYGQLALAKTGQKTLALTEPATDEATRNAFWKQDMVRAAWQLRQINEDRRMKSFLDATARASERRTDFILLTDFARRVKRPDLAVQYAKDANQKSMLLPISGYPILSTPTPGHPERALIFSLVRQESVFRADVVSPVGARGLMQLMPATARPLARELGLRYSDAKLFEPDYNLRLGSAYIQQRLDSYDGSLILAIASYNAGQGRVREWMAANGDPRDSRIDPIDWIESIPVYETRNYVQRVLEGLQVYRSRLAGNKAPLLLGQDIRK